MLQALKRIKDIYQTSGGRWTASLALDRAGINALRLWPAMAIRPEILREQVRLIFHSWGMPESDAATAVEHLLYADLHGIDSHGCAMIEYYHRELKAGRITVNPKIRIVQESKATALLDGDRAFGHLAAHQGMTLAIDKFRDSGLGAVSVCNSNHYGAAGSYALMAARCGLIGISMTSTAQPAVVPTFGRKAMLGTNPIAFAAPAARNRPFLLDMATSTVPLGKLMTAWRNGSRIPEGWALDLTGRPATDARMAREHRRLTPLGSTREMGSHKGYGLAFMVEILSSLLPGRLFMGDPAEARQSVGHFLLALDPRQFRAEGAFETDLDAMIDSLRASEPMRQEQPVMVAGDPEYAACERHRGAGIPIARSIIEEIRLVCKRSGTPFIMNPKD